MFKCIITFLVLVLFASFATGQSVGAETMLLAQTPNPSDFTCDVVTQIPQSECEALVTLYNSTDGANWGFGNWLTSNNPCWWTGVICLSEPGFVAQLDLSDNQLTGTIPLELGNLISLTLLNLSSNQLTGEIPATLGGLNTLQELLLSSNQLTGTIPLTLVTSRDLQWLSLSNNQLTGGIPSELANLGRLASLNLSSNQLTGGIPSTLCLCCLTLSRLYR